MLLLYLVLSIFELAISCGTPSVENNDKIIKMNYLIEKTWNNESISHDPIMITLESNKDEPDILTIKVRAPYFGNPARPDKYPGEFFNLWDYEVVEAFFLSDSGKYLELEFGPHGHYLVLLLNGTREVFKKGLAIQYSAKINDHYWTGIAKVPESYFPKNTKKMNAYAIHGTDPLRVYESLYPVPFGAFSSPDFHKLEYFEPIDFEKLLPLNSNRLTESEIWKS